MKIKNISLAYLLVSLLAFTSCDMFELDNYNEPGETLHGAVVDSETGDSIQTDQGSEGIRVRMVQLDYSKNPDEGLDFYCMPNGSFNNTKVLRASTTFVSMDLLSLSSVRIPTALL